MVQVRIYKFLEKTKKRKGDTGKENDAGKSSEIVKEEEKLRKKVSDLIKKNKLAAVRQIVKGQDNDKPWGQDAKVKVCITSLKLYDCSFMPFIFFFKKMFSCT